MEKFTIKNRFTQKIIVEDEAETLREVVEKNKANLGGADLWGTNLGGADLRGAYLGEADLEGAKFYGKGGTVKLKKDQVKDFLNALGFQVE